MNSKIIVIYYSMIVLLALLLAASVSAKEPNNLRDGSLEKIVSFCDNTLIEDEDCVNEMIGYYLDDSFTIEDCKREYLWEVFEASIK